MNLANKTALITGASRGIGRQIALRLSAEGARIALVARSRDGLEETKRLADPSRTTIFCADLRETAEIEGLGKAVHRDLGEVDILVNAAGVWHDEDHAFRGPYLQDTPVSQICDVLDVGLRASFLLSRIFLPDMIRKRGGKILQLSCGFAGPHEASGWLHYYVTNKAIEAFTKGLAAEVRQHEIQVNCIAPWFVASEPGLRFFPAESQTALDPKHVASLAVFMLSTDADHVSGQIVELRSKLDVG
jgi:NAD(P)-dependent dehydrogenase (short-subunit alcohol dehydrogenase family)